jgi:hypothetical protein
LHLKSLDLSLTLRGVIFAIRLRGSRAPFDAKTKNVIRRSVIGIIASETDIAARLLNPMSAWTTLRSLRHPVQGREKLLVA